MLLHILTKPWLNHFQPENMIPMMEMQNIHYVFTVIVTLISPETQNL